MIVKVLEQLELCVRAIEDQSNMITCLQRENNRLHERLDETKLKNDQITIQLKTDELVQRTLEEVLSAKFDTTRGGGGIQLIQIKQVDIGHAIVALKFARFESTRSNQ